MDKEEKKFTKEDFIKEAMDLEDITREEFNKRYEVKECNCGRGYCKGFIKVEKVQEEKKIPEKLNLDKDELRGKETPRTIDYLIEGKINEVIDYLKSKGDE